MTGLKLVLGANWDPPPAQHGNPWSWSGLVGIAAEWQFDRLFEVVPDVKKVQLSIFLCWVNPSKILKNKLSSI